MASWDLSVMSGSRMTVGGMAREKPDEPVKVAGVSEARTRDSGVLPSVETPEHFWPSVLTLEEAAAFLRVSANKLRTLATSGEVPSARIGSAWRFSTQALLEFLADSTPKPVHEALSREHPGRPVTPATSPPAAAIANADHATPTPHDPDIVFGSPRATGAS